MHILCFSRLVCVCTLGLLANCTTLPAAHAPSSTVARTPLASVVTLPATTMVIEPPKETRAATPIPPYPPLPANWHRVVWQGMSVPLPAEARTIIPVASTAPTNLHQLPILAVGVIELPVPPTPTNNAIGEYPTPPTLTLLQFSGTLDAWIRLEEQAFTADPEGGVREPVESLTIAGHEARHYHRTFSGFNYNDYYIFKPTETTLLLIYTDKETYGPLIDGLAFAVPSP